MIITRLMGGLGNQMFQYAAGRRLALSNRTVLKLDLSYIQDRTPRKDFTFRDYALSMFHIQAEIATSAEVQSFYNIPNRAIGKLLPMFWGKNKYVRERYFYFDPAVLHLPDNRYLDGHWPSEKYFKDVEPVIRKDFTFRLPLDDQARSIADQIRSKNSICLHVRRGDYVTSESVAKIIGVMGLEYFTQAVDYLADRVENAEVFVFSDDTAWCRENLRLKVPTTVVDPDYQGRRSEQDLHLMTLCKHFAISNSTFAWWGAWLANHPGKMVVTPAKWMNDPSLDTKDIRPDDWIKLQVK